MIRAAADGDAFHGTNWEALSGNQVKEKGGDFGVIAVPVFFRQDLSVNNVQIKGFTFDGQVQYAAFVATAGEIDFIDCIVRVRIQDVASIGR